MMDFLHLVIYQPLYNALVFLYNVIPGQDFGVAIIGLTLILKIFMIPLSRKQIESQKRLQELQPKIKELQKKYKHDKEQQTKKLMGLYKETKTNPFGGCLPMIFQLVFLIAIYHVLFNISKANLVIQPDVLYSFIPNPGTVKNMFLGIVDLSHPSIPLAILAATAQYIQSKMMMAKTPSGLEKKDDSHPDFAQMMSKQMLYLGPIITLVIGTQFAAGLSLYWLVSILFAIVQQLHIEKQLPLQKAAAGK